MKLLSKSESVIIYWLSVKFDLFKQLKRGYCESGKFHWLPQQKWTDSPMKNIFHWFEQWELTDLTVEIFCHWWISEKANNWFNQWKFDWFAFREYQTVTEFL